MQIFKELKIPKNSPYYEIGFEFKTLKKQNLMDETDLYSGIN